MNPSDAHTIALAEDLLARTRIGNERLFTIIARVWHGERETVGRAPQFNLGSFGKGLGLDRDTANRVRNVARDHAECQRRAALPNSKSTRKPTRWAVPNVGLVIK